MLRTTTPQVGDEIVLSTLNDHAGPVYRVTSAEPAEGVQLRSTIDDYSGQLYPYGPGLTVPLFFNENNVWIVSNRDEVIGTDPEYFGPAERPDVLSEAYQERLDTILLDEEQFRLELSELAGIDPESASLAEDEFLVELATEAMFSEGDV